MPTLQIRNIPEELYLKLIESARASRRSLTQEAIILLKKALGDKHTTDIEMKIRTLEELSDHSEWIGYDENQVIEWLREDRDS